MQCPLVKKLKSLVTTYLKKKKKKKDKTPPLGTVHFHCLSEMPPDSCGLLPTSVVWHQLSRAGSILHQATLGPGVIPPEHSPG